MCLSYGEKFPGGFDFVHCIYRIWRNLCLDAGGLFSAKNRRWNEEICLVSVFLCLFEFAFYLVGGPVFCHYCRNLLHQRPDGAEKRFGFDNRSGFSRYSLRHALDYRKGI